MKIVTQFWPSKAFWLDIAALMKFLLTRSQIHTTTCK